MIDALFLVALIAVFVAGMWWLGPPGDGGADLDSRDVPW